MNWNRSFAALAGPALLAVGCQAPSASSPLDLEATDPAPDIRFEWLNRSDLQDSLAEMKGRVVLLDFWRTW